MKRPDRFTPTVFSARRGIALVITLLMLAIVTITAVAFLAVSRRERSAVATSVEQVDARYVAETGLTHAEARLASRMSATTNRYAYGGYMVSTNYANPYFQAKANENFFLNSRDYRSLTNVSYYQNTNYVPFDLEKEADRQQYARLLGNLYYDPRPPVFVQTNRNLKFPPDFRFYLDLNRNGQFETNGFIWERDRNGKAIGNDTRFFWGDPEWVGVLENPDVPHSGTNRFIGRFAYVVVPTSRVLDINYLGNNSKRKNPGAGLPDNASLELTSGFMRNQGVGSWEMNAAAFFGALNTNIWLFSKNDYRYDTNFGVVSTGLTFSDAERLRRFRQGPTQPPSADNFYQRDSGNSDLSTINSVFTRDFVDGYSDGPLKVTLDDIRGRQPDNDEPNLSWSGSDATNNFVELNDLFNPRLGLAGKIVGQYTNAGIARTSLLNTYDPYTFYRLISQLGTDSSDGRFETGTHPAYSDSAMGVSSVNPNGFYRRAKLNLNYAQQDVEGNTVESARVASFRPWRSVEWFTNAASRLLMTDFTNGLPFFPAHSRTSSPGLGVHGYARVRDAQNNYVTNYVYDAQVHRPLQLAANIYDATTNQFLAPVNQHIAAPTVLRPLLYEDKRSPGVVRLHSYEEVFSGDPRFLLSRAWVSPDLVTNGAPRTVGAPASQLRPSLPEDSITSREQNFNVFGIPWVVGAKKGLPNFNQALWQTVVQPTRRLIVTRPNQNSKIGGNELPFAGANSGGFKTEYQYLINVTNLIGVEAWNSYFTNFPRSVRIFATNVLEFTLVDETIPGSPRNILQRRDLLTTNQLVGSGWPARQFIAPGLVSDSTSGQFLSFPPNITNSVARIPGGISIGTSFIFDPISRQAFPVNQTNQGRVAISQSNRRYLNPVISAYVTNQLLFAITDEQSKRLLDIVTLRSVMVRTNLISTLSLKADGADQEFFQELAGGNPSLQMPAFWSTNLVQNNRTRGMDNQLLGSIGALKVPLELWRNPVGLPVSLKDSQLAIDGLRYFLFGTLPAGDPAYAARVRSQYGSNLVVQVGFNPSPRVFLSDRRMANDPLVHYTKEDLAPGYFFLTEAEYTEVPHEFFGLVPGSRLGIHLTTNFVAFDLGRSAKYVNAYAPWGTNANFTGLVTPVDAKGSTAFDYSFKDPTIRSPDDWHFPVGTNTFFRFGSVGELGRIHRGTPWQTVYLKSLPAFELPPNQPSLATRLTGGQLTWGGWAGNRHTHPTNDWRVVDLFTTAYNDNAAHGQLGVNQPGLATWAAVLSGVPLLENVSSGQIDDPRPLFLGPDSPEITQILTGYKNSRGQNISGLVAAYNATNQSGVRVNPDGVFPNLGSILQVPTLSDRAPFLQLPANTAGWHNVTKISDEVLERIPQQILSLLRADEPRFVIYSFGQTLKPAVNAVNLRPGPLYGMVTNYAITGEYVTKTVVRFDGDPRRLQPVIEDQRVVLSNP